MNPLIQKELSKSKSIPAWQAFRADCMKQVAARRALAAPAFEYAERMNAAREKWLEHPSVAACEDWMLAIATQQAAVAVQQVVADDEGRRLTELLRGGMLGGIFGGAAKLAAVVSDAEDAWRKKHAEVVRQDDERSQELGETVHSVQMLAGIRRGLEACDWARGHLSRGEIMEAVSFAATATGADL